MPGRETTDTFQIVYGFALALMVVVTGSGAATILLGDSLGGWVGRNSEAWVLALLVPLHWELLVPDFDPNAPDPGATPRFGGAIAPVGTVVAMLGLALVLEIDAAAAALGLGPAIVTWAEAFLASAVIAAYLAWSRGYLGFGSSPRGGSAVVGFSRRVILYLVLTGYGLAVLFDFQIGWVRDNAEAHWAILAAALWFDLIAGRRGRRGAVIAAMWFVGLLAIPLISSSEVFEQGVFDGTIFDNASVWLGRTTEANIAAALVSIYFWVRSGWVRLPRRR